jgi:hypothetical protein
MHTYGRIYGARIRCYNGRANGFDQCIQHRIAIENKVGVHFTPLLIALPCIPDTLFPFVTERDFIIVWSTATEPPSLLPKAA